MQISVETRNRSTFRVKPVKYKARRTLTGHEQRIWATINAASSPRLPSTSSSPLTNTANCISQMLKMAAAVLLQRPASIETISDNIDAVNTLRGNTQSNDTLYNQPKFDKNKGKTNFPQFEDGYEGVKAFYAKQHNLQTVAYNLKAPNDFKNKTRAYTNVWNAMEKLSTFIDECDPDTWESQMTHLLQTAEALRADGKP